VGEDAYEQGGVERDHFLGQACQKTHRHGPFTAMQVRRGTHIGDSLDWRPSAPVDWARRSSTLVWSSRRCEWKQTVAGARD
jgi:hypothetical protein